MQVGSVGPPGIAGCSQDIPFVHDVSGFDFHAIEVRIAGLEAEIMLYHDALAAEFRVTGFAHDAIGRGMHQFADPGS